MDLDEARDDGVLGCCGIIWTICKQSAPRSRQITTPTCHHSNFYMPIAKSNFFLNTFFTLVAASAAVQRECAAQRVRELFDALHQLSGTHYRKLFSVVTLLQFLSLG